MRRPALSDASLIEQFGKHAYRVTEFTNVMARTLGSSGSSGIAPSIGKGIAIEKVARDQVDLWTETVAQGFAESHALTPELLEVMRMFACAPKVECYLARVDGAVAGGATLIIRDGIAGLFAASTPPAFRGRGVQTALLEARLARAVEASCDLAVCLTRPGSSSQRNVMRHEFATLFTRGKFERSWEQAAV